MRNYRGWTVKDNKEVRGWYFERGGGSFIIPFSEDFHTPTSFVLTFVLVDPESVSQSTGKLDINKKEIYGSILINGKMSKGGDTVAYEWHDPEYQVGESYTGTVYFDAGAFWLQMTINSYGSENLEVIGNIHEKPQSTGQPVRKADGGGD